METAIKAAQKIVVKHPDESLNKILGEMFSTWSTTREDEVSLQERNTHGLPRVDQCPLVVIGDPYTQDNRFLDATPESIGELIKKVKEEHGDFAGIVVNSALQPQGWFSDASFLNKKDMSVLNKKDMSGVPIVLSGIDACDELIAESRRMLDIRRGFVRAFAHDACHGLQALVFYLLPFYSSTGTQSSDAKSIQLKKSEMELAAVDYEKTLRKFDPMSSSLRYQLIDYLGPYVTPIAKTVAEEPPLQGTEISAAYLETQVGASRIVNTGIEQFRRVVAAISELYDASVSEPERVDLQHVQQVVTDFDNFLKAVHNLWTTRLKVEG
jgi:hypothetical protein